MRLSIIIPTRNRCKKLAITLQSIAGQAQRSDAEVIVVDNGSCDETMVICESFKSKIPNLLYFYDNEPGLLTGRHLGIRESKGEYLAFIDDDVILNPQYISSLISLFSEDAAIKLATGPCLPLYETDPPVWLSYFWDKNKDSGAYCTWLSLIDFGLERREIHPNFVFGLNFCIRKATLMELGGFHPDYVPEELQKFQGDGETGLTMKASKAGYKAVYDPLLKLHHQVSNSRLNIDYFSKRAYYQGVCDSFTAIRQENSLMNVKKTWSGISKLRKLYHSLKFKNTPNANIPAEVLQLKELTAEWYAKGFKFHGNAFKTDRLVQEWVLKENYWDYHLPGK